MFIVIKGLVISYLTLLLTTFSLSLYRSTVGAD